jgi:hypothetical protein
MMPPIGIASCEVDGVCSLDIPTMYYHQPGLPPCLGQVPKSHTPLQGLFESDKLAGSDTQSKHSKNKYHGYLQLVSKSH